MNNHFYFLYGFRLIQLLAAACTVFLTMYFDRKKPDSTLVRFVRHRDRIWFALLLLLVPTIASQALFFHLFFSYANATASHILAVNILSFTLNIFSGFVYGLAGCLFACPPGKEERFNFWIALTVAVVLLILHWIVSMAMMSFRITQRNVVPTVPIEATLALIFLAVRAARGKNAAILDGKIAESDELKKGEFNPAFAFLWLCVGLLPIPILLAIVSSNTSGPRSPTLGIVLLIVCPLCNLCGGIGCLGGIKNVAVRIILGLFLAAFFFCLSVLIALLQACSHSGGI